MKKDTEDDIRFYLSKLMNLYPDIRSMKISRGSDLVQHYLICVVERDHNQVNFMEPK